MNKLLNYILLFILTSFYSTICLAHKGNHDPCQFTNLLKAIGNSYDCKELDYSYFRELEYIEFIITESSVGMNSVKKSEIDQLKSLKTIRVYTDDINKLNFTSFVNIPSVDKIIIYISGNTKLTNNTIFKGINHAKELIIESDDTTLPLSDNTFSSLKSANSVHLRWFNLSSGVDKLNLPKNLKNLELYRNNIKKLDSKMFANLPELNEISINNPINEIHANAFLGLSKIKNLNIRIESLADDSPIFKIFKNAFYGLNYLHTLKISYYSERERLEIEPEAFEGLNNLEVFEISGFGNIGVLKKNTFKGLKNIKILNLEGTDIELIEIGGFYGLEKLTELNIRNNTLSQTVFTKAHFSDIKNLEKLDISNSKFLQLNTDSFDDLKKLTNFTCNHCQGTIPSSLFKNLSQLQHLSLVNQNGDRPLYFDIDKDFFKYTPRLSKIDVRGINLKLYPDIFSHLSKVKEAYVFNSDQHTIPLATGILNGFREFDIRNRNSNHLSLIFNNQYVTKELLSDLNYLNNRKSENEWVGIKNEDFQYVTLDINLPNISYLEPKLLSEIKGVKSILLTISPTVQIIENNIFLGINNLFQLTINFAGIISLPSGLFQDCENLELLTISAANLENIENETFKGASKIKNLIISSQKLESIKRGQLDGLASVETIQFQGPIDYIEAKAFENLPNLKEIRFSNAPLTQTTKGAFYGKFKTPLVIHGLPQDFASDESNKDLF